MRIRFRIMRFFFGDFGCSPLLVRVFLVLLYQNNALRFFRLVNIVECESWFQKVPFQRKLAQITLKYKSLSKQVE